MKVSPIPAASNLGNVNVSAEPNSSRVQSVRTMRMATQATPGPKEAVPDETLTIPANDEAKPVTEATEPLSPQYAALARQKRALQVKEREIADREKALTSSSTQADVVSKAQLKSDPLSALLAAGVTYEQLTEAVLARQDDAPIRGLEAKIKALEEGLDKKLSDRDAQAEQQVLAEMTREGEQLVLGADFPLLRKFGGVPEVVQDIKAHYDKTGEVLTMREQMISTEKKLRAWRDEMLAEEDQVQSQLAPAPAPQPQQQQRQMRTLTNRDTASVPMGRRERALAAALGTLKR